MSGSTNIKQWNPGANNQATDAEYLVDTLRTGGAPVGALFPSKTGNKLFFQLSTMVAALAQALADKGYDVSDDDLTALTAVMANIRTRDVGIRDSFRNLVATNNATHPTYQVDLTCDEAILQDDDGNAVRVSGVSVTYDITTDLDGGSETTSAWYHMWLFAKADGSYTHKLSLDPAAPTAPAGYTFKAYVGAVYNDSSGNLRGFYQSGHRAAWKGLYTDVSLGTATSWTSFALSVPVTAKVWRGDLACYATADMACVDLASDADATSYVALVGYDKSAATAPQVGCSCLIKTPQTLYYKLQYLAPYATSACNIHTGGWEY